MNEPLTYFVRFADGQQYGPADMQTLIAWTVDGRMPKDAVLIERVTGNSTPVMEDPVLGVILRTAQNRQTMPFEEVPIQSSGVSSVIPYHNPPALIGYYISIFSLLPIFGALLGPAAIVLGAIGLKKRSNTPEVKGAAHAWIAISLGIIGTLISGMLLLGFFPRFFTP